MSPYNLNKDNSLDIENCVLVENMCTDDNTILLPGFDAYRIISHDEKEGYKAQSLTDPRKFSHLSDTSNFIKFKHSDGKTEISMSNGLQKLVTLIELNLKKS